MEINKNGINIIMESISYLPEEPTAVRENNATAAAASTCTRSCAPREFVVYRRRWLVLGLYVLFCMANAMQWIQFAIIGDLIVKYYGVSYTAVNWTSIIYMAVYVPCIFPATWLLNSKGLRVSILVGSVLNCLGAWLKVVGVRPELFWVAFSGQTVAAVASVWVLSVPAAVAATWFGPDQISTACAIGVFGLQTGNALGFLLPPLLVTDHQNPEEIGADLSLMFYSVAIFTTVLLVCIVIFFQAAPPSPPSLARAKRCEERGGDGETVREFLQALRRVMRNPRFLLLFLGFGINMGVYAALTTFFNQTVLANFSDAQEAAGYIGVAFIVGGIFGTLACGYILDRTRKFKETLVVVYVLSIVAMLVYTFLLEAAINFWSLYIASALFGLFLIGYDLTGYELGVELCYPEAEATTAGVLTLGSQAFSVVFSEVYALLLHSRPDGLLSNLVMAATLLLGLLTSALVSPHLGRQAASVSQTTPDPRPPPDALTNHY